MEKFIFEHILKKYVDSDPEVIIPDGVTTIGEEAFKDCSFITSVTIPEGVTSIGNGAFKNCTMLKSINIPSSVTTISLCAFSGCTSLASIEIPNSVSKIGWSAFSDCVSLTKVVMPKKLPLLEGGAFSGCVLIENIEDIIQGENNLDFWKKIFGENATILLAISHDAPSDVVDFSLKHKKTCIGLMVKYNRTNLISRLLEKLPQIKIGELDELIEHARQYNSVEINAALLEYKNKNYSKEKIEKHENNKLDKLLGLKSLSVEEWKKIFNIKTEKGEVIIKKYLGNDDCVVIPEMIGKSKVTAIDEKAFFECSMTSVVIPNTVKKIGNYAFKNCTALTSVKIPSSVTKIGYGAFIRCTSLASVDMSNSVKEIGGSAFSCCTSLTSIVIPKKLTCIDGDLFGYCTSLTSIRIPSSVTKIGDAFKKCSSLVNIDVDENNTEYQLIDGNLYTKNGKTLVRYAPGKTDNHFEIPNHVTEIYNGAFNCCTSLTNIFIPDSVTEIGSDAFRDCTSLRSIVIPKGITSISSTMFCGCTSLESVVIPDSVTEIDFSAFGDCTSLESVTIPDSVTKIGPDAFEKCTSLTSIEIPESVTSIGRTSFANCTSLTSIFIPKTVIRIEECAFSSCSALEIQCEATEKPEGWWYNWNSANRPVVWGCKKQ